MARFSDINRADELKAAAIKLATWRSLDAAAKKAAYTAATAVGNGKRANRSSRTAFIQPFGSSNNIWFETKMLAQSSETPSPDSNEEAVSGLITLLLTAVVSGFNLTLPAGAGNISVATKKIQLAKARITEKTGTGVATTSRITGRPYTKFNSNTLSCPYGKSASFTSEAVARGIIRTTLLGTTPSGKSVGFTPQGDVKIGLG